LREMYEGMSFIHPCREKETRPDTRVSGMLRLRECMPSKWSAGYETGWRP